MKPADVKSLIGLDRFATCQEIQSAILLSAPFDTEMADDGENFREEGYIRTEFGGKASEDALWLAIAGGMQDFTFN